MTCLTYRKPKESTQKKPVKELINSAKLQDIKSACKNHLYFYTLAMKNLKKIKKIPPTIS